MATGLRNSNGQIVINEQEAEADIRKIEQAVLKLGEVREILSPSKLDSDRMLGRTRIGLEHTLLRLIDDLVRRESECHGAIDFIRAVVTNYKRIDAEYAKKAASHSTGGFSGGGRSSGV